MKPDLKFMETGFARFRDTMFHCPLPAPRFELTRATTFRGKFVCHRIGGKVSNPVIRLSLNFDLPQKEWEDVLIHEMIHYYIALTGIRETSHGPTFRKIMNKINSEFGRNLVISVRHHRTTQEKASSADIQTTGQNYDQTIRRHYVCVALLNDGKMGLFRSARSRLFQVWDIMKKYPQVTQWRWIFTIDPMFNRIPKSLKGNVYIIEDCKSWLSPLKNGVTLVMNTRMNSRYIDPLPAHLDDLNEWVDTNFSK